ncbi:hypothetical protein BR93DRAFT_916595 [Coniochaeta sp. PMI_546]|nr:hypothetical protein BR93DRAFT_916595 [Coniochaeta sp. PMI_546]
MEESSAPKIVIGLSAITTLSLIFLTLRFFCKARYGKKLGWDDHIALISWFILLVYSTLTIVSCKFGVGRHLTEIPPDDQPIALELLYIGRFFGIIAVTTSKTSFAVTLLRLATKRWHRWAVWSIIATLNTVMGLTALFLFVQCTPVYKAWIISASGTCWDSRVTISYSIFAGAYSAAMDFILALFPWFLIWNLQMNKKEKVGVAVAMSLGVLAGITAVVKATYLTGSSRSGDFTFTSADLLVWSGSETAVTLIATSIPFLRLMFREVSRKSQLSRIGQADGYRRADTTYQTGRDNMHFDKELRMLNLDSSSEKSLPGGRDGD